MEVISVENRKSYDCVKLDLLDSGCISTVNSWKVKCIKENCNQICVQRTVLMKKAAFNRDSKKTLRLGGGGGGTISASILGGTRHFFLLTLYSFKTIGGGTCSKQCSGLAC